MKNKRFRINMSTPLMAIMAGALTLASCSGNKTESSNTGVEDSSAENVSYAAWMADSEIKRTPDPQYLDFRDKPKWEYTNGLICSAMMEVYDETGEERFFNYAKSYADSMINESGDIKTYKKSIYNIDRINPGKFLIDLYEETGT